MMKTGFNGAGCIGGNRVRRRWTQRRGSDEAKMAFKTVQVKNWVLLFWREKKLYRTDCVAPQPHSLQNAKADKLTRKSHGNHGRRRSWPLLPPLGCPRPFQSTARFDRVMGDATYDRRHRNQARG